MDNILRKRAFILILVCLFLCTGCFPEDVSPRMVKERAEEYMKCFADKDEEKLFGYFAEGKKTNRKEQTMEEIKEAFDSVIDGNIVSYEYGGRGGKLETVHEGKIIKLRCWPSFRGIKTDKGKAYMIEFFYNHVWKEYPERVGLNSIYIYNDNGESLFIIGEDSNSDW